MIAGSQVRRALRPLSAPIGLDRQWLAVFVLLVAAEGLWWMLSAMAGAAPAPFLASYLLIAAASLAAAIGLRWLVVRSPPQASTGTLVAGMVLVAVSASLFLPLKYAIPAEMPFWLDRPLALFERNLFGRDAWAAADHLFGWAIVPVDRIYALWLPTQSISLFSIILTAPSAAKSRALSAYALSWFVLGVVAAALLASAGPIFFDRLFGGDAFAPLAARLGESGAWMVITESDAMWASFESGKPGFVAGISAMPSMHVAISFWMALAARDLAPRLVPLALAYTLFMWIGSVLLGWHYAIDGLVAVAGAGGLYRLARAIQPQL